MSITLWWDGDELTATSRSCLNELQVRHRRRGGAAGSGMEGVFVAVVKVDGLHDVNLTWPDVNIKSWQVVSTYHRRAS